MSKPPLLSILPVVLSSLFCRLGAASIYRTGIKSAQCPRMYIVPSSITGLERISGIFFQPLADGHVATRGVSIVSAPTPEAQAENQSKTNLLATLSKPDVRFLSWCRSRAYRADHWGHRLVTTTCDWIAPSFPHPTFLYS